MPKETHFGPDTIKKLIALQKEILAVAKQAQDQGFICPPDIARLIGPVAASHDKGGTYVQYYDRAEPGRHSTQNIDTYTQSHYSQGYYRGPTEYTQSEATTYHQSPGLGYTQGAKLL